MSQWIDDVLSSQKPPNQGRAQLRKLYEDLRLIYTSEGFDVIEASMLILGLYRDTDLEFLFDHWCSMTIYEAEYADEEFD